MVEATLERPATTATPPDAEKPSIAFVACVEAGLLEPLTVRLAESLRRWGGRFSDAPFFAVTPRLGPPLAGQTRRRFRELGVDWVRARRPNRYAWHHYMNKMISLLEAEGRAGTRTLGWLDSDILLASEPSELALAEHEDFAACVPDDGVLGSTGPGDPREAFWSRACAAVGVELESLPWVTTCLEGKRIRLYFNSGVFVYRTGRGFAEAYQEAGLRYLDACVPKRPNEAHFMDQVVLGLTMHRLGLRWRELSHSHNLAVGRKLGDQYHEAKFNAARVIHYHDSMGPEFFEEFLKLLARGHPHLRDHYAPQGPARDDRGALVRGLRETLRALRGARRRAYYKKCGIV